MLETDRMGMTIQRIMSYLFKKSTRREVCSARDLHIESLERRELCAADTLTTYHIGNSLTGNLIFPAIPDGRLSQLAGSGDKGTWQSGYAIRPNSSLTSRIAIPYDPNSDSNTAPGDSWIQHVAAVPYDALILQPFYNATIRQEIDSAKEMIQQFRLNPANATSRVLIYATWGANGASNNNMPFQTTWNRTDFTLDDRFEPSEQTFQLFMRELQVTVPDAEIIPAGHVFDAVLDRMNSPEGLPGLTTTEQLIGDGIHATNAGGYLAGITSYAVLYGTSPVGLGYTASFSNPDYGFLMPASAVPIVQEIAWNVANSMRNPNAARFHNQVDAFDVNNDGSVSPIDVLVTINFLNRNRTNIYLGNFHVTSPPFVDVDGDNFIAPNDVLRLINQLHRRATSGSNGEGEPSSENSFSGLSVMAMEKRKLNPYVDSYFASLDSED